MAHEKELKIIHINPDFLSSRKQTKPKVHVNPAFLHKSEQPQTKGELLKNVTPQLVPTGDEQKLYPTKENVKQELSKPDFSKCTKPLFPQSNSLSLTQHSYGLSSKRSHSHSPLIKGNAHAHLANKYPSQLLLSNTNSESISGNTICQTYNKVSGISGSGIKPKCFLTTDAKKKMTQTSVYSWRAVGAKVPSQNVSLIYQSVNKVHHTPISTHNSSSCKFHRGSIQPLTSGMSFVDKGKQSVSFNKINKYSPHQNGYNYEAYMQQASIKSDGVTNFGNLNIKKSSISEKEVTGDCKGSEVPISINKSHVFAEENESLHKFVSAERVLSHCSRNSNILINPKLLKYLSSNSDQDKKSPAVPKPKLKPLASCVMSNTGQITSCPLSAINKNSIAAADASKKSGKYKVISKTKLVRQSSGKLSSQAASSAVHPRNTTSKVTSETLKRNSKYKIISKTKLVRRLSSSSFRDETRQAAAKATSSENSTVSLPVCSPKSTVISAPFKSMTRTRRNSVGTRAHPKRRYSTTSRTKLYRRLSSSSSSNGDGISGKPKYSIKTKTKLVRRYSGSGTNDSSFTNKEEGKTNIKSNLERKKKFSIISKTKLVRRSDSGMNKTKIVKDSVTPVYGYPHTGTLVRRHKLVRNVAVLSGKAAKDSNAKSIKTVYKIVNSNAKISSKQKAARGIISKYKINHLKSDSADVLRKRDFRSFSPAMKSVFSHASSKDAVKHSDRIINIGGILYKSTKTSLTKQLSKTLQKSSAKSSSTGCIVWLRGDQFHLSAGGRSLKRITKGSEPLDSNHSLSRVHIGGLTYSLTKAGQYELTKIHQARAVLSSAKHRSMTTLAQRKKRGSMQKRNEHCIFFNRFGRCTKKDRGDCPYIHDLKRVAVCTRFLKGRCPVRNCPFSHTVDPDKMPVCSHFVRSTCTRDGCPYRHVRVNPSAPLCLDFLKGRCLSGEECKKQHILVCDEFSRTGKCPRGVSCPLSHHRGRGKKRKSVSLEPPIGENDKQSVSEQRKRKLSESRDVLGGPKVKKRIVSKSRENEVKAVKQRYFQAMSLENEDKVEQEKVVELNQDYSEKTKNKREEMILNNSKNEEALTSKQSITVCNKNSPMQQMLEMQEVQNECCKKLTLVSNISGYASDLNKTRQRLLQEVDKIKHSYSVDKHSLDVINETNKYSAMNMKKNEDLAFDKTEEVNLIPQKEEIFELSVNTKVQNNKRNTKEHMGSESKLSNNSINILQRPHLPKTLPSYIPLSMNEDVKDL
ncbi:uncharacterized protein ZC3H3 [Cherax quadricarinatus]|nr:uncharacterized protein LOC128691190 [Cherax quadricarinatus]XP_053636024.1 uncharacterized protein LOC128691190 [Cherax quadricarinatus]